MLGHYLEEAVKHMGDVPEDWLNEFRHKGQVQFNQTGLPHAKIEEWKYTPLKKLANANFAPDVHHGRTFSKDKIPADILQGNLAEPVVRVVVVNGIFRRDLTEGMAPHGVTLTSVGRMIEEYPTFMAHHLGMMGMDKAQIMLALNSQYFTDGFVLHIKEGTKVDKPIEILFYNEGEYVDAIDKAPMFHPRHIFAMDDNTEATVVEHHTGKGSYTVNHGYEIMLGNDVTCHHYRLQNECIGGWHLATTNMRIGERTSYDGFTLAMGAALSRHDVTAHMEGEKANCRLNGSYLMDNKQHCDNTILIHHKKPHGLSNQMFKGILDGMAKGVFQGKIFVHKGAQKTDGYQLNNAMMLSPKAEMDVKPELEIYADDVKCSHGATTGRIDEGPLFYLRSRGIPEKQARKMLMQAFLGEAFEEIWHEGVRAVFMGQAEKWLDSRMV